MWKNGNVRTSLSVQKDNTATPLIASLKVWPWTNVLLPEGKQNWGVDILTGKQNRDHRDIDIDFDCESEEILLKALNDKGYTITTDWSPSRIELHHPELGYLDIHPLIINKDGSAKQAAPDGGWYHFEPKWFSHSLFEGRVVPCISAEAQKLFHSGYELRDVDIADMKNLDRIISD